ncbi:hypothetical protein DV735_g5110, partial [Chaetothyriales sp. CBS 134920]
MAAAKKYAGLPDLDIAAPEIYETPELTEGPSTAPTATLRTDSPLPSDADGDERLDHQRIDQESARRRFEPFVVDARNVNFGDTVNADERISYRARTRRRRRAQFGDGSDDDSDEEESLGARITRLKREALEVRLELDRRKDEGVSAETDDDGGVDEVETLLSDLNATTPHARTRDHAEQAFLKTLRNTSQRAKDAARKSTLSTAAPGQETSVSAISPTVAVADFSDRLTALESALGLTTVDPTSPASAILPTLHSLSEQITTLSSIITPAKGSSGSAAPPPSLPNLDALQSRIQLLTAEADKLSASRKAALASLDELQEARLRYNTIRTNRTHSRPTSSHNGAMQDMDRQEAQLHSGLFLQEQASKINALYQLLPTIQGLQPLLPTVLERLRSLSVIHAGAAEARGELDEVMRRQDETREEIKKWREAVESVEKKMTEMSKDMKENVDVVGGLIGGVEQRIKALGPGSQ